MFSASMNCVRGGILNVRAYHVEPYVYITDNQPQKRVQERFREYISIEREGGCGRGERVLL